MRPQEVSIQAVSLPGGRDPGGVGTQPGQQGGLLEGGWNLASAVPTADGWPRVLGHARATPLDGCA